MELNLERVISLLNEGMTNVEISNVLNVSRSSVVRFKSKYNLKSRYSIYKKAIIKCVNCEKEIKCLKSDNRKFCSHSCSAIYINTKRGDETIRKKNIIEKDGILFKICECCKINYEINRNDISLYRKYCSIKCQKEFEKNKNIEKIKNGDISFGYKIYKNYLIEVNGDKCMECGWCEVNKVTNKVPIELEHIDGNSNNNSLENLKLLCPNCHSLTPTYRALNRGNGRHKRMERYKDGKSF